MVGLCAGGEITVSVTYYSQPKAQYLAHSEEIDSAIARVLDSGQYILGPEVGAFEEEFAEYLGISYAVGVNSGTDALALSLIALGIQPGDEVIAPSFTAPATVAAIHMAGATPILVDVEESRRTLDPQKLAGALSERTRAVLVVHLYGLAADMESILQFTRQNNLRLVEDCAQCTGGFYQGKRLGTLGDAGCFSFYPTKNLGAVGDGGMVVCGDRHIAEQVHHLREYGWDENRLCVSTAGRNSRLDELQAAILRAKLPHLDACNESRRSLARNYESALAGVNGMRVEKSTPDDHVFHLYVVEMDDRIQAIKTLKHHGILAGIHYETPVHRHPCHLDRVVTSGGMENTDRLASRVLSLPMYPEMEKSVIEMITSLLGKQL
jgi:dTDP-4-amino-4,6-dideoxygalactose transaminase